MSLGQSEAHKLKIKGIIALYAHLIARLPYSFLCLILNQVAKDLVNKTVTCTVMKVLRFNQDASCCVVNSGANELTVYNCDPFGKCFEFNISNVNGDSNDNGIGYDSLEAGSSSIESQVIAEMLFSTSLLAVVDKGQGINTGKKLKIVNIKKRSLICEIAFPSLIVDVVMNRKRICVLLDNDQIFIYDISCMKLMETLDLWESNNEGNLNDHIKVGERASNMINENLKNGNELDRIRSKSNNNNDQTNSDNGRSRTYSINGSHKIKPQLTLSGNDNSILCYSKYSSSKQNPARILNDIVVYDALNLKPINYLNSVHKGCVLKTSVSIDGKLLATASEKGTIIRIHKTGVDSDFASGPLLYKEFRRGSRPSHIHQLLFNKDSTLLVCVGDSDTIHIFRTDDDGLALDGIDGDIGSDSGGSLELIKNRIPHEQVKKFFSRKIKSHIPNQNLHRDFAHINMDRIVHTVVGFPEEFDNKIYVASDDGSFKTYTIPSKHGQCVLNKTSHFI